ncbi:MAG: nucleotidyltransferase domain-containing protein [Candidatus Methanoplasma sp.]|jgi:predicted nucleotidyltransferase|nr:nucleotidyltransferase domain-containing protein [Candidatus Methanoplasma sp.]
MDTAETRIGTDLEQLKEIVAPIAAKHGVTRMYIFGSRARGEADEDSDYDLCIVVPKRFDLMDIGSLLGDLTDALGKKVDIVCEDNLQKRPHFMEEVLRDRRILFEA